VTRTMLLPPKIQAALDETGLPYEVENGNRHRKIRLAGRMVGIIPMCGNGSDSRRAELNIVSQIRRGAAGHETRNA
jgi:hypothetical protein